jgi:hypothetical protein
MNVQESQSASEKKKIFGIGLNKTGTTTLAQCGRILGFSCASADRDLLEDVVLRRDFSRVRKKIEQYDLFEDWPWPLIYKELDELFPGSKFILTVRKSAEKWLQSLENHSMKTHPFKHCRKLAYGYNYPHKHEKEHLGFYVRHNEEVREYFRGRHEDFLELCWENGQGFAELCDFLDCEVPEMKFPHANKGSDTRASLARLSVNRVLRFTNF